ncbi:DUF192 domain-containing protein [Paroceanicella profunda]|uniref:DUF192 domain-containing protein n=1 Tax=Paroceanicella profunda TaxID=2579971 RepID=A0A5B8G3L3_9RHOB|nr:DUF192 domain-containing protein [Paroceanicella profunda]QDL93403.1 DUF192 domain-containing protein [Paroceanicella profunda]
MRKSPARLAAALGVALILAASGAASAACAPDTADLRGGFGTVRFSVELADDAAERAQGLMFRESMPKFSGMLFVYDQPAEAHFWMKNTLIPLDMLFLDATGTVRHIHPQAVPGDLTPIPSEGPALAVLEINGGLAARLGLKAGDVMRHPAFDPAVAAWPCSGE